MIWNRVDCCQSRLNNIKVSVDGKTCATIGGFGGSQSRTVSCSGAVGSVVKVEHTNRDYLTLCEVQVYGTKPPVTVASLNVLAKAAADVAKGTAVEGLSLRAAAVTKPKLADEIAKAAALGYIRKAEAEAQAEEAAEQASAKAKKSGLDEKAALKAREAAAMKVLQDATAKAAVGFKCDKTKNWVHQQPNGYSQSVIKASSIGEAISICRGKCNGCPAFFYQKHRNGHQICGFYKTIISGTRQWHGHAEGALCEIKPCAGFKRYNPKFVYPKFKNNPDNYLNYCVAYTSPGGACKMQFCMGGGSKACRSQCSAES